MLNNLINTVSFKFFVRRLLQDFTNDDFGVVNLRGISMKTDGIIMKVVVNVTIEIVREKTVSSIFISYCPTTENSEKLVYISTCWFKKLVVSRKIRRKNILKIHLVKCLSLHLFSDPAVQHCVTIILNGTIVTRLVIETRVFHFCVTRMYHYILCIRKNY